MKKVYAFSTIVMNGTVTAGSEVALFASRELAELTRTDVMEANRNNKDVYPMTCHCTEVREIPVYKTKDEIPFYQKQDSKAVETQKTDPVCMLLQRRLRRFAKLAGREVSELALGRIRCDMAGHTQLTLYAKPLDAGGRLAYGEIYFRDRVYNQYRYLTSDDTRYFYERLDDEINRMEQELAE